MKKIVILLTVLLLCISGCAKKEEIPAAESSNNESAVAEETESHETVEVDESLFDVTLTFPNSFFETFDSTAEEFVAGLQEEDSRYKKVVLNDDRSVSVTISKSDYRQMMIEMEESVNESLQEIIDDENFSVTSIEHNKNFSEFNVKLSGNELGFSDSLLVLSFTMLGGFYQMFNGDEDPKIIVNFIGADGTLIETWNSSEMK